MTGYGTVFGRPVCVFSQDFTVFGGSLERGVRGEDLQGDGYGPKVGCPVVGINDSGGARIQEGVVVARRAMPRSSGGTCRRPAWCRRSRSCSGPCAGGAVYSPAITDFVLDGGGDVVHVHHRARCREGGDRRGGDEEELGGAAAHASKSGVAHLARRVRRR